jgi:hypothetical protein
MRPVGNSAVAFLQMECDVRSQDAGRVLTPVLEGYQSLDQVSAYRVGLEQTKDATHDAPILRFGSGKSIASEEAEEHR